MKKIGIWIILGIIGLLTLGGVILFSRMTADLEDLLTRQIDPVDLSEVPDGTYRGSYSAGPISVVLDVTVLHAVVTEIEIIRHVNGQGAEGEAVLDAVLSEQSLDVDTIAGATYSSMCLLLAVEKALTEQNPGGDS